MKHSELRHQPRHVNPRIQVVKYIHKYYLIFFAFLQVHSTYQYNHNSTNQHNNIQRKFTTIHFPNVICLSLFLNSLF